MERTEHSARVAEWTADGSNQGAALPRPRFESVRIPSKNHLFPACDYFGHKRSFWLLDQPLLIFVSWDSKPQLNSGCIVTTETVYTPIALSAVLTHFVRSEPRGRRAIGCALTVSGYYSCMLERGVAAPISPHAGSFRAARENPPGGCPQGDKAEKIHRPRPTSARRSPVEAHETRWVNIRNVFCSVTLFPRKRMSEDKDCFVVSPIGEEDSNIRERSDKLFDYVIKPAVEQYGYDPIRADHIAEPGIITSQIIEHVVESPLVIADLTGSNANVFFMSLQSVMHIKSL